MNQFIENNNEKTIIVRGRIHKSRRQNKKLCFIVLRDNNITAQCVLFQSDKLTRDLIDKISSLQVESIVELEGILKKVHTPINSTTIKDFELSVINYKIISESNMTPIQIEDLSRKNAENEEDQVTVSQNTRLNNRVIDLRTPANQSIFKIQSKVCELFRNYLLDNNFTEIHSPKLLSTASESGSSVFEVKYFDKKAFLAQSPQFYKQMAINSDFQKVFEIGSVFRAENSNTHRHLTEFIGLDLEMRIENDYSEVLEVLYNLMIYIFRGIEKECSTELNLIKEQYDIYDLKYSDEMIRISYRDAVQLLNNNGVEMGETDDLSTTNEKLLGKLIKDKYDTDLFILDKFPLNIRPFYTMPTEDGVFTNSYDIILRGQEILSGAQRIHDANMLENRIKEKGVEIDSVQDYVDSFKYGSYPHGGGGFGLERFLLSYLGLDNIRKTSLFPRDPTRLAP